MIGREIKVLGEEPGPRTALATTDSILNLPQARTRSVEMGSLSYGTVVLNRK
jgi:hypothetical protein